MELSPTAVKSASHKKTEFNPTVAMIGVSIFIMVFLGSLFVMNKLEWQRVERQQDKETVKFHITLANIDRYDDTKARQDFVDFATPALADDKLTTYERSNLKTKYSRLMFEQNYAGLPAQYNPE